MKVVVYQLICHTSLRVAPLPHGSLIDPVTFHPQMQQMLPEDESAAREARLAKEVFLLAEQNERLEDQVRSLSRENRNQIELLRRMKHEHDAEVGSVIKQHQVGGSRDCHVIVMQQTCGSHAAVM